MGVILERSADGSPDPRTLLDGLTVLECGHFVAAPFATRLLADLGADVIKVEPLTGDPIRQWGEQIDGNSLWWSMHARNKRSIAIDWKSARGRALVLSLVARCDVVVENFRPGQLDRWGLSDVTLRAARPNLVIAHVSGYGQDGPYKDKAAFGVIGEAIGGLRHLTNHPPGTTALPPVRVGVSIGDSIAGIYTAFGVMAALWRRDRAQSDGRGYTLDTALTESVLSLMEGMLPEFGALGKVKQPTGGAISTAAPSNAYPTADGRWLLIAANSEPLFARLATLIGEPELITQDAYRNNPARVRNAADLDDKIASWTSKQPCVALETQLNEADIPNARAYTAADCVRDEQYKFRNMVREVADPLLGNVLHSGVVPHVPECPGTIRWTGPKIGQHTDEILGELADLSAQEIERLRSDGVVA